MKINQLKSIHSWIRETNTSEIVFVSSLILPIYLQLYNYAITQINKDWNTYGIIFGLILYIIGIFWMKKSQSKNEKNQIDLAVLKNYILDKNFKFMSYAKLLEIDKRFTENRIKELIFIFPNDIRLAKLKNNVKGIKLLNIEEEKEDIK